MSHTVHTAVVMGVNTSFKCRSESIKLLYHTVCEMKTRVTPHPEMFDIEIIIATFWCLMGVNEKHGC